MPSSGAAPWLKTERGPRQAHLVYACDSILVKYLDRSSNKPLDHSQLDPSTHSWTDMHAWVGKQRHNA